MSEKRRDSKGRVLRNGETQRPDGMYMYRYNDAGGVRRTIYSWRLVASDKLPTGKRNCEPLREMEKRVTRDVDDGIKGFEAGKKTLNDFFDAYMGLKRELKISTRTWYIREYNLYVRGELGNRIIGSIKYSDVKKLYLSLFEKGLRASTIEGVSTLLCSVFTLAVRDGYIRTNPACCVFSELKKKNGWIGSKRHALTIEQQNAFINFVRSSPVYSYFLPLFTVFLGTGCRAGEIIGLRWEDCDFTENVISINHNLVFCKPEGEEKMRFVVSTPKTESGRRKIPMLRDVREALLHERLRQMSEGFNQITIDGYSGFIFQSKRGNMLTPTSISQIIDRIVRDYNRDEIRRAEAGEREPVLIPHFSPHILRHTFCTRFCENETNLKVIQEIMGHANIATTMDIYNEATMEKKKSSMENLEGKIKIS